MADIPSTRTVLKAVTERWHRCNLCGGDGRFRAIAKHGVDRATPSAFTSFYWVEYGEPTSEPCNYCKGQGGYWLEDYNG